VPNDLTLELLQAHHRCRQTLGYLGLALPMLLVFGGIMSDVGVLPSVSDYYHSALRDLLVGALFATGIVLCTQVRPLRLASSAGSALVPVAGVAALGVALFPNESGAGTHSLTRTLIGVKPAAMGHYLSAILFLTGLAYLCLIRFPIGAPAWASLLFRGCGWLILCGGVLATLASVTKLVGPEAAQQFVLRHNLVFWIEAMGIWAFGLSWLVKDHCDMATLQASGADQSSRHFRSRWEPSQ
jgi:hypothetical protein